MTKKVAKNSSAVTLFLLSTLMGIPDVWAKTLYVEKWGNDVGNMVCKKSAPCETIGHALGKAKSNDRIKVGPGIYVENLVIDFNDLQEPLIGLRLESTAGRFATQIAGPSVGHSLEIRQPKVKIGRKGKGFTITGGVESGGGFVPAGAFVFFDPALPSSGVKFEGNRFGAPRPLSSPVPDDPADVTGFDNIIGIQAVGAGKIQVRQNIFQNNAYLGLYCDMCDGALVQDNRFESNISGVSFFDSNDVVVMRNVSSNNRSGLTANSDSKSASIKDNVIERNEMSGMTLGEGDGALVQSNILSGNMGSGVQISSTTGSPPLLRKNLAVGNSEDGIIVQDTDEAKLVRNTLVANGLAGIALELSNDSVLDSNDTIGNNPLSLTNCGIDAEGGTHDNIKHYSAREISPTCVSAGGSFNPIGAAPSRPRALSVSRASALTGG